MLGLIRWIPLTIPNRAAIKLACSESGIAVVDDSTGWQTISKFGSVTWFSATMFFTSVLNHAWSGTEAPSGIPIVATDSRGIAFRKPPPSIDTTRAWLFSDASDNKRFMILFALPRPRWISMPEWPPAKPLTVIWKHWQESGKASGAYDPVATISTPPAQPMVSSSSSSVSKFSIIWPVKWPACNSLAPVIPVSSSIVNNASMGGWSMSVEANTDMMAATPRPLSAPSVVPLALTQSPSTSIWMPCESKSNSVSAFFWCTMSKCDCKTTVFDFSLPAVAGLRIMTLPAWSTLVSKLSDSPNDLMNSMTRSSFFEGRGTAFRSQKWFQTLVGSSFRIEVLLSAVMAPKSERRKYGAY